MSTINLEIFKAKEGYGIKEVLKKIDKSIGEKNVEWNSEEKTIQTTYHDIKKIII